MSGTPLNTWSFEPLVFAELRSFLLGLALGIVPLSKSDLLEGYYKKSAKDIVMATDKFVSVNLKTFNIQFSEVFIFLGIILIKEFFYFISSMCCHMRRQLRIQKSPPCQLLQNVQ